MICSLLIATAPASTLQDAVNRELLIDLANPPNTSLAPAAAAALCCCYLSKPAPCVCVPSYNASCNSVCDSDPMFSGPCGSCLGPPGSGSYCNASRIEVSGSVTFFVSPDTHFTQCGGVADVGKNVRGIAQMNGLPGEAYPAGSIWGGAVDDHVRGVIVPGDLVDDGCAVDPPNQTKDSGCAAQLANFTSRFKVAPSSKDVGTLRFPSFEGAGNHDGGNSTAPSGVVRRALIERNRERTSSTPPPHYSLSANGLHYSWEWGGVHFVMLGVYPGTAGDCASGDALPGSGCSASAPPWGWHSPENSLNFLIADLASVRADTPVVLFTHYGLRGFGAPGVAAWPGYSPDFWWSAREAAAFAHALRGHNVVALIHGHTHACAFYQWDLTNVTGRVIDVYNAPALQKGGPRDPPTTASQFLVFEVDTRRRRFRAFQRIGSAWGAIRHEKPIDAAPAGPHAAMGAAKDAAGWVAEERTAVGIIRVRAQDAPLLRSWPDGFENG